jgi:hypothetical protein
MSLRPKGMKRTMPPATDKSMALKGGLVNAEPTRKGVAPTPATLGPRDA